MGRFTQAKQASSEEADKEFPTTQGKGGLFRHFPTSLG